MIGVDQSWFEMDIVLTVRDHISGLGLIDNDIRVS